MTHPSATSREPLVVTKVRGHGSLHLAAAVGAISLCGRRTRPTSPLQSFRSAGCLSCLAAAHERGELFALDGDQTFINLTRLIIPPQARRPDR